MNFTKKQTAILARYAKRRISRPLAARLLGGISERQVNRWLAVAELERVPSPTLSAREAAHNRRVAREQAAKLVAKGKLTIEKAALRAGCSERTLYRYMEKL